MAFQRWIGFVAVRYFRGRRRNRSSPAPVLGIIGIATGVLALTVIISVMNGFQLGFIESILEISSYHLRIESFPSGERGEELLVKIIELPAIKSAVPFRDVQGLARGNHPGQRGVVTRGLGPDALEQDPGMASKLALEAGSFNLEDGGNIILGAELARRLEARVGDWISLVSVAGDLFGTEGEGAANSRFFVTGIFRSDFYEYDLGWAFININRAGILNGVTPDSGGTSDLSLGIKLKNRWQDHAGVEQLRILLEEQGEEGLKVSSWRDYNRAFFGALRTEKLFMFLLVGLIFIVVGLNIFQAQRRSVLERREEIGLLRAMGASDMAVRLVFVWDGFIIGGLGAGGGMILGLLISFNIQTFFTILEGTVNFFISILNLISSAFMGGGGVAGEGFAIFSPTIFYIKAIPSRPIPHEVLIIFLFGFLSALLSAWFASGRVSRTRPAEVLRYE
ncbi:putative lipoprotein releasing system, permease protein [Treponema primitia ZAS-2]|uniref:Putative lipoprotein releasing system, permease protein n=1 Tax=Treponema primitia (strain ATCC BAA-887 / DSM 12427 / ZAS-2) TaxID=545694 RepID=F5YM17_TREPZ|nr:ABC transporter permease [Treponema primitia]AEF85414.1 putative lipoprotein releasing system, permease protein [Treponema primitia ZAS-2]